MGIKRLSLLSLFLGIAVLTFAQKGTLKGLVLDQKTNEPLVGATVMLEGTTTGTITDFDGNYRVANITPGTYTVRCSFISYETKNFENITIQAGQEVELNISLSESTVEIGGVQVVAKANRESEAMNLVEQREATSIKESIGSKRLTSMGVSDAANATSKISGVTRNEGSGGVYIRGLGDRYLKTSLNGLPIPSDNVEKKNIDLNLFSTNVIENVGISKTYSGENGGDQASGNVNINTKKSSNDISIGVSTSANTNVLNGDIFSNFKTTQNMSDVTLGVYSRAYSTLDAISSQSWNTKTRSLPIGYGLSFTGGGDVKLFEKDLSIFATINHDNSFEYHDGIFKFYRSNVLDNSFTDAEQYESKTTSTGLLALSYELNDNNKISVNSMAIVKANDQLYEQGRNGEGYVFDQDPQEEGAFVRDQNLKQTQIYINQLLGNHTLSEKNKLEWAAAYNMVKAEEPNRIRNEVNILDENTVQFAHVGDYQQRKSMQEIKDNEINGFVKDHHTLVDEANKKMKVHVGGDFRIKERDFTSQFIGVRARGVQVASIDNMDEALLNQNLYNNGTLIVREPNPDTYNATLNSYAGFANFDFGFNKISGVVGVRYEMNTIDIDWDVANYVGRAGSLSEDYNYLFPSMNLKFDTNDKSALRLAASKTVTIPEFKELAPFEYVSPTGRVTKGNPDLVASDNYNVDLKYEIFPSAKELISLTGFYKLIKNPINKALTRGSSGYFYFANTGEEANVYGLELETRFALIKAMESDQPELTMSFNATKMWFSQDLLEEFQYNNKTESGLEGAAEFIFNGSLSYSNNKEKAFMATLTGNYSSDKIFALGAPESFASSETLFNNEIIEKGFATVDLVLNKKFSDRISLKLTGKNLLNPKIQQTQKIEPLTGEASTNEVVSSYRKGVSLSLGLTINLN